MLQRTVASKRAPKEYIYIDGAYLHRYCDPAFKSLFGVRASIDFGGLLRRLDGIRAFYYDCLEEEPRSTEGESALESRIQPQRERIDRIEATEYYRVRLGTLKGAKNLRQKEVDVRLAVDMLTDAFEGRADHFTLVAGDLDFRPVLESLTRLGKHTRLVYYPQHCASELKASVDRRAPISLEWIHNLSTHNFQTTYSIPRFALQEDRLPKDHTLLVQGAIGTKQAFLSQLGTMFFLKISRPDGNKPFDTYMFNDRDFLVGKWAPEVIGNINWESA